MAILLEHGGDSMSVFKYLGIYGLAILTSSLLFIYLVVKTVYRCYFDPLSSYPGPKIAASTRLWYVHYLINGNLTHEIRKLHQKYGPVVRIAPNELSYSTSNGWNDIYGFRNNKAEMAKDTPFYTNPHNPPSILSAKRDKHALFRRLMSRGFSEAALREQEPIITGYVDLLMRRLRESSKEGKLVEMVSWLNFFTFDVIGDLTFGEPFGCLESSNYHPWVQMIFDSIHLQAIIQALSYYPRIDSLIPYLTPKSLIAKFESHKEMTKEKVLRRKETKVDRADFISNLIKPENHITDEDIFGNCGVLIVAGSETTATVLSSAIYFLLKNPEVMSKLVAEIRSGFKDPSEINFISISKQKYTLACLNETLRLFPPVPSGLSRVVPRDGDLIDGKWVSGGTHVSVLQLAANTSESNWLRPFDFIPERWMDDPRFIHDDQSAMQSFSTGPRNCIGKNLAYIEMRLVLTRLLWEFDIELVNEQQEWNNARVFMIWEKNPLFIRLKPTRA